jgi:hypothetical protein
VADPTSERIVRNNVAFREANERIRERADHYDVDMERIPFLCECPRPGCVEIVRLTRAEYSDVRSDPNHFMTAAGHEIAEEPLGQVVSQRDGYVIVEKDIP